MLSTIVFCLLSFPMQYDSCVVNAKGPQALFVLPPFSQKIHSCQCTFPRARGQSCKWDFFKCVSVRVLILWDSWASNLCSDALICSKCGTLPPESCFFSLICSTGSFMGELCHLAYDITQSLITISTHLCAALSIALKRELCRSWARRPPLFCLWGFRLQKLQSLELNCKSHLI